MFVAGCVVELIDLPSREHKYIRTAGGYSIGALVVRENLLSIIYNFVFLINKKKGSSK